MPGAEYVCEGVTPVGGTAVSEGPGDSEVIEPPSGSVEVEASKETGCSACGEGVVMVKAAIGATLPTDDLVGGLVGEAAVGVGDVEGDGVGAGCRIRDARG